MKSPLANDFPAKAGLIPAIESRTAPLHETCALLDNRHKARTLYQHQQCTLYASQKDTRRHTSDRAKQIKQRNRSRLPGAYVRPTAYAKPATRIEPPVYACLLQGHRVNAEPSRESERENEQAQRSRAKAPRHLSQARSAFGRVRHPVVGTFQGAPPGAGGIAPVGWAGC